MAILPSADFVLSAIAYASGLSLLCLGLTLTYMTTKVPNFAHATIAITGSIVTLLLIDRVYYPMATWSIYIVAPIIAFIVGAALSTTIYVVVLRPLADRGNTVIGLMIATFALDIILVSLLTVLVYQLPAENLGRLTAQNLLGFERRITILGITGTSSAYVLPVMAFLTALALYVFLNKTKFGIAMRAAIENPDLASVLGINVRRVYLASWLIAGGIAGMAGSLMAFRIAKVEPAASSLLIVSVFAGSIVGGLGSIYGGLLGGLLVGLSEKIITLLIQNTYNELLAEPGAFISLTQFERLVSLTMVIIFLLFAPRGLTGLDLSRFRGVKLVARLGARRSG